MATANSPNKPIGWAHAFRDVVITSMNRGQLPVLCGFGVFGLMIWRMPADDIALLLNKIVSGISDLSLVGWVLWASTLLGWYSHFRYVRLMHQEQLRQIGETKSKAQARANDKKPFPSRKK